MNFKEVFDLTKNLIDETDSDVQIDSIVKSSINEAYTELCGVDKRLSTSYIPVINGIATLPEDIETIVSINPILSNTDKIVGNAILTDYEGIYTLIYAYTREDLVSDNDTIDLSKKLHYALALYACSIYFAHRKKDNLSQLFMQQYEKKKYEFMNNPIDSVVEEIVQDYYSE